jgi:hypothetical protein
MLTSEPTMEMILEWKKIFEQHKGNLMPNRKSGIEVDKYFREKYNLSWSHICELIKIDDDLERIEKSICSNFFTKEEYERKQ